MAERKRGKIALQAEIQQLRARVAELEREQAQNSPTLGEERLRLALEAAGMGTWEVDLERDALMASGRTVAMFGFEKGTQPRVEDWLARLHPEDRERVGGQIRRAMADPSPYETEYRILGEDGSTRWVFAKAVPILDAAGRFVRLVGVAQDITGSKRAEEALRVSKERLRLILDAAQIGTFEFYPQTGKLLWNDETKRIWGLRPGEELTYPEAIERVHPEDREAVKRAVTAALDPGSDGSFDSDYGILLPDGSVHWTRAKGRVHFEGEGKDRHAARMVGIQLDITHRKRTERALAADVAALTRMHALSTSLLESDELEPLLQGIMDAAVAVAEAERGTLQLLEGDSLRIVSHHGHEPPFLEFFASAEGRASVCGEALKRGERVVVEDVERSPLFAGTPSLPVLRAAGVRAVQSTPLLSRNGALLGILTTQWGNPHIPDKHDLWRIDLLARLAADLIEHGQDVTERKQAEQALRESERKFAVMFEKAAFAIVLSRLPEGVIVDVNDAWVKAFGYSRNEAIGKTGAELNIITDPEARERLRAEVAQRGSMRDVEMVLRNRSGDERIFSANLDVIELGGRKYSLSSYQDIAGRKQAEQALRESEKLYRAIGESIHYGVWVCAPDGRNIYASEPFLKLVGLTQEQCSNFGWGDVLHPDDAQRTIAAWKECVRTEGPWDIEHRYRGVDGEWHPILARGVPVRDGQGRITCWAGINLDIGALKRAEESLRQSERQLFETHQRLAALMQALPVGVAFSDDATCQRVTCNPAFLAQFEARPEDNLSASAPDPAAPGRQVRFFREGREIVDVKLPLQRAVRYGRVIPREELEVRLPSGQTWFLDICAAPIRDRQGNVAGGVAVTVDITERKRSEERLRHAQKLESIGVLAGGIAHDFNNLLTAILGNASLLQLEASPAGAERLQSILEASEKAAALTRQLLAYAGKGQFQITDFDVRRMVCSLADLIRVSIPKNVDLELAVPRELPAVRGDSSQVQQVLMNLVINAAEATDGRADGQVSIAAAVQDFNAASAGCIGWGVAPGPYITITVRDNGCGMDEQTRQKIFDPFFTTKFMGRGLGLAAVEGILRSHKGAITVESQPGQGTTFTVYLPSSETYAGASGLADAVPPGQRAATVLIVDDEEGVRGFTQAALERLGHRVLLAHHGRQALDLLANRADVDLVLLDLIMPVLGGVDAFSEMRRRWPRLPVLVASGHSRLEALKLGVPEDSPFLEKPYTIQTLATAVEKALDPGARAAEQQ